MTLIAKEFLVQCCSSTYRYLPPLDTHRGVFQRQGMQTRIPIHAVTNLFRVTSRSPYPRESAPAESLFSFCSQSLGKPTVALERGRRCQVQMMGDTEDTPTPVRLVRVCVCVCVHHGDLFPSTP